MPERISRQWLIEHGKKTIPADAPIKIMQFGEGNFLRAFVDWIFKRLNDSGLFSGAVRVVQPIAEGMVDRLRSQEYVYSLLLRGMHAGKVMNEPCFIDVVSDGLNPYDDWQRFLGAAREPGLRFVVSNTTEAGIVYAETERPSACPETFPAKVAAMLAARYDALSDKGAGGLVFLPCELIEKNGGKLREAVLRHIGDWGMAGTVGEWVERTCRFYNTLVDRIVTGFPAGEAEAIWRELDCQDAMLDVGEYFHLWVIEGDPVLAEEIPFAASGLNVVVTRDLKPYRDRKVRVLNGAHTGNVLAAYLAGVDTVGEMMRDPLLGAFLRDMVGGEILPGVKLPDAEKRGYAESVFERFENPFVKHLLLSISLNSVSKWKVRVLPSLKDYVEEKGELPDRLVFSLAALIVFYRGSWVDGKFVGRREGGEYPISDDRPVLEAFDRAWAEFDGDPVSLSGRILSDDSLWDEDLTVISGLRDRMAFFLGEIVAKGIRGTMEGIA